MVHMQIQRIQIYWSFRLVLVNSTENIAKSDRKHLLALSTINIKFPWN